MTTGPLPGHVPAFALGCVLVGAAYLTAATALRRRGDAWPWRRDAAFAAGCAALVWGLLGRLPGEPFTAHTVRHLLLAMAGPLLCVLARPLTLALRVLPPGPPRRGLVRVAHSAAVGGLSWPPLTAVLDVGGLWLLHRTGLFASAHRSPVLAFVVDLHLVAAGLLFSFAVCRLDPVRRHRGLAPRAATLLAAGAAHAVLAKGLYATGPPGTAFAPADLRLGAQVMYYGGDLVEVALALVLGVQWYAATGRRRTRRPARSASRPGPACATRGAGHAPHAKGAPPAPPGEPLLR